jgi:hypothetical protein
MIAKYRNVILAVSAVAVVIAAGGVVVSHTHLSAGAHSTQTAHAKAKSREQPTSPSKLSSSRAAKPRSVAGGAALSSACKAGIEDEDTQVFYSMKSIAKGKRTPVNDTLTGAYQVTLTNVSRATVEITGFTVIFHSSYHSKTGSDKENGFRKFISPKRSLTWTETPWPGGLTHAPFAAGVTGAVDSGATCRLQHWYHE